MMQYLCTPASCPRGGACTNGPLHLRKDGLEESTKPGTGLKVFFTGPRGFGLRTEVPIEKGKFVLEYRGEVISRDESYRRVLNEYRGKKSFYFLDCASPALLSTVRKLTADRCQMTGTTSSMRACEATAPGSSTTAVIPTSASSGSSSPAWKSTRSGSLLCGTLLLAPNSPVRRTSIAVDCEDADPVVRR